MSKLEMLVKGTLLSDDQMVSPWAVLVERKKDGTLVANAQFFGVDPTDTARVARIQHFMTADQLYELGDAVVKAADKLRGLKEDD